MSTLDERINALGAERRRNQVAALRALAKGFVKYFLIVSVLLIAALVGGDLINWALFRR